MTNHDHYSFLCAMAVVGRASDEELAELTEHATVCAECKTRIAEFNELSYTAMPALGDDYDSPQTPSGFTDRFVARARTEGIPLRLAYRTEFLSRFTRTHLALAAMALALVVTFVAGMGTGKRLGASRVPTQAIAHADAPFRTVPASPTVQNVQAPPATRVATIPPADDDKILRLNLEIADLKRQLLVEESASGETSSQIASLKSQVETLQAERASLQTEASAKDVRLAALDKQLTDKDRFVVDQIATLAERQGQIEKLNNQLAQRQLDVDKERRLLAASAQARDLIVARNLHIIDVHDNDRNGRNQPFGRIFYTEGHSLVFYAYDLAPSGSREEKVAFHVWGGSLKDQQRATNLGIFRSEDTAAGRWVLTFDDPRVLAQINTVFVTAEPPNKTVDQPKGKRTLFAFLGEQPNHP